MFKVGDKVKIIKNFSSSCNKIGDIGIISDINDSYTNVKVENRMGGNGHAFDELELVSENKLQSDWIENPTWEQLLVADGWEFELTKSIATLPVKTCGRISKSIYYEKSVCLCQNVASDLVSISNLYGYKYSWVITCSSTYNTKLKIRLYQNPVEHLLTPNDCFILPKKWCILTTYENSSSLNEYLHKNSQNYRDYNNKWEVTNSLHNNYFHSEGDCSHSTNEIRTGFTEITFKDFQQYVFKQSIKKEILNDWCIKGCLELKKFIKNLKLNGINQSYVAGNATDYHYYPVDYNKPAGTWEGTWDGDTHEPKSRVISFQEFESTILNNELNFQPLNNPSNEKRINDNIITRIIKNDRSTEISYISGADYTIKRVFGNRRIRFDYSGEQIYVGNFNSNNAKRPCIKY